MSAICSNLNLKLLLKPQKRLAAYLNLAIHLRWKFTHCQCFQMFF